MDDVGCIFCTAIPNEPVSLDEWARTQPKGPPLKGQPSKPHFTALNNVFLHTGQQVIGILGMPVQLFGRGGLRDSLANVDVRCVFACAVVVAANFIVIISEV